LRPKIFVISIKNFTKIALHLQNENLILNFQFLISMASFIIEGGHKLSGEIVPQGAKDGAEILVPANEEMIIRIEDGEQKIYMRLPMGY
jgi:hypothetical protein